MTDAGRRGIPVLARELRRPSVSRERQAGNGNPHTARVGGQIKHSGKRDGDEPEARQAANGRYREVFEKGKERSGEADDSAALCAGCPLGLVHLNLREFCFCRKLEDARVR